MQALPGADAGARADARVRSRAQVLPAGEATEYKYVHMDSESGHVHAWQPGYNQEIQPEGAFSRTQVCDVWEGEGRTVGAPVAGGGYASSRPGGKVPGHIARMEAARAKANGVDPRAAAARNARPSFNSAPSSAPAYTPPPASPTPAARSYEPAPQRSGRKVPGHIARMEAARAKANGVDPRAAAARNARPSFNSAPAAPPAYTPPPPARAPERSYQAAAPVAPRRTQKVPGHIARMEAARMKAGAADPRGRDAVSEEFAQRAASFESAPAPAPAKAKVPAHILRMQAQAAKAHA